jgi:hypothetical protein
MGALVSFSAVLIGRGRRSRSESWPDVNLHTPSNTKANASKGDVCSASDSPLSKTNSVTFPPVVFARKRLAIPRYRA